MALGKYSRVDGRKSSSGYCWTVSIVVFVALCLVGVWMMTSSSFVPGHSSDVLKEDKSEVTRNVAESNDLNADDKSGGNTVADEGNTKQFEDNQGDLPEDATKGDTNVDSNQDEKNKSEDMDKPEGDTNVDSNQEENKSEDTDKPEGDTNVDSNQEEKNKSEDTDKLEDESGKNSEDENKDDNDRSVGEGKNDAEPGETNENKSDGSDEKSNETSGEEQNEENKEPTNKDGESNEGSSEKKDTSSEVFPSGAQSELLKESTTQNGAFSTQAKESNDENKAQKTSEIEKQKAITWKRCNTSAGPDYIPCLDNLAVIRKLPSTKHYEHRERHCPADPPTCVVPLPDGYKRPKQWPTSREKIWYHNVPHTKLAQLKGHQNWVKVDGEYLIFPGGGTQFKNGALHYIDFIQQSVPDIAWGSRSRVVLDVGCGVASFGGFLFERDVLTMSLAPKDEHEAQVQFALERGIPAISAVMGTKRLSYPGNVFDIVHCARCRVPWHIEGGKLLLELNRLLRPGGYFVWSATPIYRRGPEDVGIWKAMKKLTKAMCWEVISLTNDSVNGVGIAVYKKPTSNDCYEQRSKNDPPLCQKTDDPNAAWNVPLQACMHKVPVSSSERGSQWPKKWPARAEKTPYWLSSSQVGVYGKPAPEDFDVDAQHWKRVVSKSYLEEVGMDWSTVRNVMDMRAIYGGFAAALREKNLWVMNVVSIDDPDTLPLIYERGLFGIYHDWCESFSTYPRTYDLLHADHLFSMVKKKCNFLALVAEADRMLRPGGRIIVRDTAETITELEKLFKSLHWDVVMTYSKDKEGLLCAQKSMWRPDEEETVTYAIA